MPEPRRFDLILLAGPGAGERRRFTGRARIGRLPDNDLQLDDPAVSRRHALVAFEGERLLVKDLGSRNGTFAGGRRVREAEVPPGAVLAIGPFELRVEYAAPAQDGRGRKDPGPVVPPPRPAAPPAEPGPRPVRGVPRPARGPAAAEPGRRREPGLLGEDLSQRSLGCQLLVLAAALGLAYLAFRAALALAGG